MAEVPHKPAAEPGAGLELRLSVTGRCQLSCPYCGPADGADGRGPLSFQQMLRFVRGLRRRFTVRKVRITGGEPLLRPGLVRLVRMLAREGISELAMTTNGQLLAGAAAGLRRAGLRRVNVSLDSLDPATFRALNGGKLRRTLAGIDAALCCGLAPVKLNTVLLRDHNLPEAGRLVRFALHKGCQIRFLELMPLGPGAGRFDGSFVPTDEIRSALARRFDLTPLPRRPGSTSRNFRATDRRGRSGIVGFISPCSEPFCDGCRRLRLTSSGILIGCLRAPAGPDLGDLLRGDGDLALCDLVADELNKKAGTRRFPAARSMARVGG